MSLMVTSAILEKHGTNRQLVRTAYRTFKKIKFVIHDSGKSLLKFEPPPFVLGETSKILGAGVHMLESS